MSNVSETFHYHDRVAAVRAHFSLTQTKMAKRVGIVLRAYQNYERGEREMPVALVRALYAEFSVDPVWLLTGAGSMILVRGQTIHLDQERLDRVVDVVGKFEAGLEKALPVRNKSRLMGLLYEESALLSAVAGVDISPVKVHKLLDDIDTTLYVNPCDRGDCVQSHEVPISPRLPASGGGS